MSHANVWYSQKEGQPFPVPSTTVVPIVRVHNSATARHSGRDAILLCYAAVATSVPSAVSGYLSGCVLIDTGGAADAQIYVNEGTLSSCSFVACPTS